MTIMSADGTPVQMNTNALQNIAAQNSTGIIGRFSNNIEYDRNKPKIVLITKICLTIQEILLL